jgi:hypothetical protein
MTEKLSLPEISALLVLMSEAREISNPELKTLYGLTLDGKERRNLNDLKLVDSSKRGRAFAHELTDTGWARLAEEIHAGIAFPTGSMGAALRALLVGLERFRERSDQRYAEIFAREPFGDIEAQIRTAYTELSDKPGAWVSLTELRPLLGEATRAEIDDMLTRMNRMPDVNIIPESNQKTLSQRDREAAVIIGDQDKHLISIGAR